MDDSLLDNRLVACVYNSLLDDRLVACVYNSLMDDRFLTDDMLSGGRSSDGDGRGGVDNDLNLGCLDVDGTNRLNDDSGPGSSDVDVVTLSVDGDG